MELRLRLHYRKSQLSRRFYITKNYQSPFLSSVIQEQHLKKNSQNTQNTKSDADNATLLQMRFQISIHRPESYIRFLIEDYFDTYYTYLGLY